MDTTEPGLDAGSDLPAAELLTTAESPRRMPSGTIAPESAFDDAPAEETVDELAADDVATDEVAAEIDMLLAQARELGAAADWPALADTLRRLIELGQITDSLSEEEMIDLHVRSAQVAADELHDTDAAIAAWREVIALDAGDLRALDALETLFAGDRRWRDVIATIEKRALVIDDDDARCDALLEAATIAAERLADPARAIELCERVRRAQPGHPAALARLATLLAEGERWAELVEVQLERSELEAEVDAQVALLHDVARIYEQEMLEAESAFYVLQAAFARDHGSARTLRELERVAGATGRWQELIEDIGTRATELEAEDAAAAADLWVKIGRWYADRLQHVEYAIHAMQQALRLAPSHARALAAIAELQRQGGSWTDLTETLRRQAAVEQAHDKRIALYVQIAEAVELQAPDPRDAVPAYEEVLAHDPTSQVALAALTRLHRSAEAWPALVDVLTRRHDLATDDDERVEHLLAIGEVHDLRRMEAAPAIAAYERARELAPTEASALAALEALYDKTGQTEKYLAVLEAELALAEADADRVALYERIAAVWEERFGKLDRAAEAYTQILAIEPRNEGAYRLLERLYQQAGRYDALVATYRDHLDATADRATRAEIAAAMGKVCETRLHAIAQALDAYDLVLTFAPGDVTALAAIARLAEQTGEWDRALDALGTLVRSESDVRRQDLYHRMGRILHRELDDADGAEAHWRRGLAIDAGHLPTIEALIALATERGDWRAAAELLVRAEGATRVAVDQARFLFEAATMTMHRLGDPEAAKALYARVIALDPEHALAGRPLADLYFEAGEWAELSPVIEMLCRKAEHAATAPGERHELTYRAARCAEALGALPAARAHYDAALALDGAHLPTQIARADVLFRLQDWDAAARAYQAIVTRGTPDVRAQGYARLGQIRRTRGDREQALAMFTRALEHDPQHRDALRAVVELQTQAGDWAAVAAAKRGLLATADEREKTQLSHEIAAIYRERLQSAPQAVTAYLEALARAPEDRQLLQKVLDLHIETKQWRAATEIIARFIALEPNAYKKGVYYHAAATLCRDELRALDEAVDYFDCALDAFFAEPDALDAQKLPRALMSFEAIDAILTARRDWTAQERAYRDMIRRLPAGVARFHQLHVSLIDGLGEIYRSRLKRYADASGAFEIAQQLDPENKLRRDGTDRAEILAELHVLAGPDHADKAIAQHYRMLAREPFKYDSYTALARLYRDTRQADKYGCLCTTLAFLRKATPEEQQVAEQHRPRGLVKAPAAMAPASWAALAPAEENRAISALFAACGDGVAAMKAFPLKEFGVRREERHELAGDQLLFSRLYLYAASVLGVRTPDVYLRDDDKPVELQLANVIEKGEAAPAFLVRAALLQGKTERELAFVLARRLAFLRPEYYLRMLLPTHTELAVIAHAAIALTHSGAPVPASLAAPVQQYLPQMKKRIAPHALAELGAAATRLAPMAGDLHLAKWGHAVDAAAHRAGFVVCGDLETAARAVAVEPVVVHGPTAKDKIRELVLFSISEPYFQIRAQMGLAVRG